MPRSVAELGPGDSLGIGLAALIGGVQTYQAFDIVEFASRDGNLAVFDEIVRSYHARQVIPGPPEHPNIRPLPDSWDFPACFAQFGTLDTALSAERLEKLRVALAELQANDSKDSPIRYVCPWNDAKVLEPESLDFAFAQAVLEHVEDVPGTYRAIARWLRPGGLFSQTIGLDSHGLVPDWNGHWVFDSITWRVVRGRWAYLINRVPLGEHLHYLEEAGLEIVKVIRYKGDQGLPQRKLAEPFRSMPPEDATTKSAYVLVRKP